MTLRQNVGLALFTSALASALVGTGNALQLSQALAHLLSALTVAPTRAQTIIDMGSTAQPMAPAKVQTFRTNNGSSVRIQTVPAQPMRCSEDMAWLANALASKGIKAYNPSISVNDPKNRRPANEISDWCKGEGFKLWDTQSHKYLPNLSLGGRRLSSVPTGAPSPA